jgi:hypothetical protein
VRMGKAIFRKRRRVRPEKRRRLFPAMINFLPRFG